MAGLRRCLLRLRSFLRPDAAERELAREMAAHLAILEDEFRRQGMGPADARAAARRAMGGVEQARERQRDARSLPLVEDLRRDLALAGRTLLRARGFTIVVVLTLGAGIGANTAIFTVINALLLRPLPYPESEQLVQIVEHIPAEERPDGRPERRTTLTSEDADALRLGSNTLSDVGLYGTGSGVTWSDGDQLRVLEQAQLHPSIFPVLRLDPVAGRAFRDDDARPGSDDVALLSTAAWHRYFGGDPSVLGRTLTLNGREHAVVGVMPETFAFPHAATEIWTPLVPAPSSPNQFRLYRAIARVRDGVSLEAAASEVGAIYSGLGRPEGPGGGPRVELISVRNEQAAAFRPALRVLVVAVGVVLLIACANVAHLLLARTTVRLREFGVRAALGAGRVRLMRQVLTESLLLASLGGAAGLALAYGSTSLLTALWPGNLSPQSGLPRIDRIDVDTTVLAFTVVVAGATGLLFGLVPALQVSRTDLMAVLRDAPRTAGAPGGTARSALVVAQTALAVVLVAAAGLLIHSFVRLATLDAGFTADRVLTFQVATSPPAAARRVELNDALVERLKAMPGVAAAGYTLAVPLQWQYVFFFRFDVPGGPPADPAAPAPLMTPVSADYLQVIGTRLIAGRFFRPEDDAGAPVLVVNESLARRSFTGDPVGQLVRSMGSAAWEVVSVVADAHQRSLTDDPAPAFYVLPGQALRAMGQGAAAMDLPARMTFTIRADRDPDALVPLIQTALRDLEPHATLMSVVPLHQIVSSSMSAPRFYAVLLGTFAALAIVLAAVGIYGLLAYTVAQRTREIGVRMALGASRRGILALVLGQGAMLAGAGVAAGLLGAFVVTRYLSGLLFGITPLDPLTFVAVSGVFAGVALLASYVPARRATRVDPLVALRSD